MASGSEPIISNFSIRDEWSDIIEDSLRVDNRSMVACVKTHSLHQGHLQELRTVDRLALITI